ncbi:hypothetical protein [Micromonospora sp. HM5-17]|uniref:hypothetical protein n=1 Tax=Micromonospora sp. HM5-17 TaxID=2487710 RepID=UPI000F4880E7|nr:hypothetical protein [Micromonospora sp. HM5-17]ROT26288.1 hypothetical protein EF879_25325 [Micromonospora sp. HM5-17]
MMNADVMRQVRDAEKIAQWDDATALDHAVALRQSARSEGYALADVIAGEWGEPTNAFLVEQPPLF